MASETTASQTSGLHTGAIGLREVGRSARTWRAGCTSRSGFSWCGPTSRSGCSSRRTLSDITLYTTDTSAASLQPGTAITTGTIYFVHPANGSQQTTSRQQIVGTVTSATYGTEGGLPSLVVTIAVTKTTNTFYTYDSNNTQSTLGMFSYDFVNQRLN